MASANVVRRKHPPSKRHPKGHVSYRVEYRLGGRAAAKQYAGTFARQSEAEARKRWLIVELAAMRVPDLSLLEAPVARRTVREAIAAWCSSRVDVADGTRVLHRVALNRAVPTLGDLRVDEIVVEHVRAMVAALADDGKKRETIRKTVKYLAAVLEEEGVEPNPARAKRIRLPHEEPEEIVPPTAEHVEAVFRLLAEPYRLPLLWLDWSGARVASVENVLVGDYDEPQGRVRLRASTTKTRSALWVELHPAITAAIDATLPREATEPLFVDCTADRLRTAIARACKTVGVPVFSPHDLRHRRISLLHRQGRSWAEIGRLVGQRKLSITADTYTHVLSDGRELDYGQMCSARVSSVAPARLKVVV